MLVWKCWQICWNVKVIRQQSELLDTPYSGCQGKYHKYLTHIYKYPKNPKISLWIKETKDPPYSSVEDKRMEKEEMSKNLWSDLFG